MKAFAVRNSVRFKGEIPLEVKQGVGITRDFSACGLYFFTDQAVLLGESLELVMLLEHQNQTQKVRLRCQADVVRVEAAAERVGVAVAITKHLVDSAEDAAAHSRSTLNILCNPNRRRTWK